MAASKRLFPGESTVHVPLDGFAGMDVRYAGGAMAHKNPIPHSSISCYRLLNGKCQYLHVRICP